MRSSLVRPAGISSRKQLGHSVEILYSTYTGLFEAREGEQRERGAAARQAARGGS